MKNVYLFLAIAGGIVPYFFFGQLFGTDNPLWTFLEQAFANPSSSGLTSDILISSLVFWIWSYGEARQRGMRRWWGYVLVNLLIGLSCAFPLFLYVRGKGEG